MENHNLKSEYTKDLHGRIYKLSNADKVHLLGLLLPISQSMKGRSINRDKIDYIVTQLLDRLCELI